MAEYLPKSVSSAIRFHDAVALARESMPTLDQVTADYIRQALILCNGQIAGSKGAAKFLGINPNTLRKRMDKLNIPYGRQTRN